MKLTGDIPPRALSLAAAFILVATGAIYSLGLTGPYVFDDYWVLTPVEKWFADELSWQQSLAPDRRSIVDSRPVAMASFMLTTWLGGVGALPTKLGNVLLHLLCGALIWRLASRLFAIDNATRAHAQLLGLLVAAVWLLHPLHVSTVLYAVQRMSQLSTTFALLCVLTYMSARQSLSAGETRRGTLKLFVIFPTLFVLGILSKQNAAIIPYLCLVIEVAHRKESWRSHNAISASFFLAFAIVPAIVALTYLATHPGVVLDGYKDYDFSLQERLLTQPRALMSYIKATLLPYSPAMGLYTDDFIVSGSLIRPVSTMLSIGVITLTSVAAFCARRWSPLFFAGWLFFIVCHLVESSFLPLEMYYEHRNYLSSVGLLIAVFGLGAAAISRFRSHMHRLTRMALPVAIALLATLSVATMGRVTLWQDFESMVRQGVRHHPDSMRAVSDLASVALNRSDYVLARSAVAGLIESEEPRKRIFGRLHMAAIACYEGTSADLGNLELAVADAQESVSLYEAQMVKLFDNATQFGECAQMTGTFARALQQIVDAAVEQPETSPNKHVSREVIARLYMRSHQWPEAERQAEISWNAHPHPPTGALLAHLYLRNHRHDDAAAVITRLQTMIPTGDVGGQRALRMLLAALPEAQQRDGQHE